MGAKLIAYECVAAEHRPTTQHPDKLTVHQSEWAFCPFDARAKGHEWKATGGVPFESLARRYGFMAAPSAPSPSVTTEKGGSAGKR